MDREAASILIVDDVPDNLQVLSDILIHEGFTVRPVTSGAMALRTVAAALPQLVLADIKMPGMDGYELCRRLKADERTREIPVLFISALGETKDKVRAFEVGGVDYVTKPFQSGEIVARVRTHLAMNEMRRSLLGLNRDLEERVRRRTEELAANVALLREELAERQRAEEALRLTRFTIDHSSDSIFWIREDATFADVNAAACRRLGYAREELLSLRVSDVDPDRSPESWPRHWEELRGSGAATFPARHRRKDGSVIDVEVSANFIRYEGQELNCAIARDVTERRAAENQIRRLNVELEERVRDRTAQLEESNRELEAFSYSVSHDLRAPLRAIEGFSGMVVERCGERLDAETQRLLGIVRTNARRMSSLIDDLLAFSRSSRTEMRFGRLPMGTMAQTAFEEVAADPGQRARIDLRIGDLPDAEGDAALLRQVWLNLLSNAVKFSAGRERPAIAVEGTVEGGEVVYRVRDNGAGFDMAYAGKLFGVFQRLHGVNEFEGTGVGLALVKRIVSRHRGRVWAEGAVDEGATFSFTLPASAAPG